MRRCNPPLTISVEAYAEAEPIEAAILQRIATLIFGAIFLGVPASAIALNLVSGAPIDASVILFSAALAGAAIVCFWVAVVVDTQDEPLGPVQPAAGVEAAWRLREMKRNAPSRYLGLKGLSRLAPWKL